MSGKYKLFLCVSLIIVSSAAMVMADDLPQPIKNHYRGSQSIYWKIRQIIISPIFDRPETVSVEFYIERPNRIYVAMPLKQIYTNGDTVWTYLEQHKQVQKSAAEHIFNPFDFVDSAQTIYDVISIIGGIMIMKAIDQSSEPDSIEIRYKQNGKLQNANYLDLNGNKVTLDFKKEEFNKGIPQKMFLNNLPKDVKIIDLDRE